MNFVLPPKSQVGYLDPEIAGEGQKVIMSDGEQISWNPPPTKPVIPDLSEVKSLKKYFNRTGFSPWPAWVYHPVEEPRLLKSAEEGMELGVFYRKTSDDERARFGSTAIWDWNPDCQWRPSPYAKDLKFNPKNLGQGKTLAKDTPNPSAANNDLLKAILPEVVAAVAKIFAPLMAGKQPVIEQAVTSSASPLNALSVEDPKMNDDQELSMWQEEAKDRGIKIDKRWGLERLKAEIEKAA